MQDKINDLRERMEKETIGMMTHIIEELGVTPRIQLILVGEDSNAEAYAKMKCRDGKKYGIEVDIDQFDSSISFSQLEGGLRKRNQDDNIHGIMIESPLPQHISYDALLRTVNPYKDIDGLHPENLGKLLLNDQTGIVPGTPNGCKRILERIFGTLQGVDVALIGHGKTVGAPLASLLSHNGVSVTTIGSNTQDKEKKCQQAHAIISAVGIPGVLTADMVTEKSIVINVGTKFNDKGKNMGDAGPDVEKKAQYVTPLTGGLGPIAGLGVFQNLAKAIGLQR